MNLWTEIHTALLVGRTGTVRAAACELGIHRATVSRHIDMLEERVGTKLFIRHPSGYTPTELGRAIIDAGEKADAAISAFMGLVDQSSLELTGVITLSALSRFGGVLRPTVRSFCETHPKVTVRFNPTAELPRLELGEAHIAITGGAKPNHPDYVVIPYYQFELGLFAHRDYLSRAGFPKTQSDLSQHKFVGSPSLPRDYNAIGRFGDFINDDNLALESNSPTITFDGIMSGIGIGLASKVEASAYPELVEVLPLRDPLMANVWITTHVDVHRTRLVSEFVRCLKQTGPSLKGYLDKRGIEPNLYQTAHTELVTG